MTSYAGMLSALAGPSGLGGGLFTEGKASFSSFLQISPAVSIARLTVDGLVSDLNRWTRSWPSSPSHHASSAPSSSAGAVLMLAMRPYS